MIVTPMSYALLAAIGVAAGAATVAGGALALRFERRVHLVLGFSAGAVIGVALLDLLPEALTLGRGAAGITALTAGGFLAYLVADRMLLMQANGSAQHRGHFGAGALTVHSLLDGLGIGLGLQASLAVGLALAAAVLAHDLADGVNTVNVSLTGSRNPAMARRWLLADAAAPLVGLAVSPFIVLPAATLARVLAVFAGFFLYIGASELLPESHHRHPRAWTTVSTVLGVAFVWTVARLGRG
jgi:ZIP family zinc transporter